MMTTLEYAIEINAPKEKVWKALWKDENYRRWTSVFSEGSYAESDWREGSPIKFLTPNGSGMFSVIKTKKDNEQMVFEHLGEIKNGVEEKKDWAGNSESYFLSQNGNTTTLTARLVFSENFADYFNQTFPKALEIVRQIAES
jgi:uncharacterized protein YndB with AHSA1/START domain